MRIKAIPSPMRDRIDVSGARFARMSVLVPFGIYIVHLMFFGAWIVDDAGITFAYARSTAEGFGPVSQPGASPVEGYSNPAWMFVMVPFLWLGMFDPVVVPKILAALLVFVTFTLLRSTIGRIANRPNQAAYIALSAIAASPSFVIWTGSGLENSLYACGVAALVVLASTDLSSVANSARTVALGLVAGVLAITRPDGVLFAVGYPALLLGGAWFSPELRIERKMSRLLRYGAGFAAIAGSYFAFRLHFFGEYLPNTFYAKGSEMSQFDLERVKAIVRRTFGLVWSLGGFAAVAAIPIVLLHVVLSVGRRRFALPELALFVFLALAVGVFVILPTDWMKEYRFATPLITLFYPFATLSILALIEAGAARRPGLPRVAALVGAAAAIHVGMTFWGRSDAFRQHPTISFQIVRDQWALPYNQIAEEFGLVDATAMIPDLGGTLFRCELRIIDLANLCDHTVARTIGTRGYEENSPENLARFYDYVFDEVQPTFIRSHSIWTDRTRLFNDPRLERDYYEIYREEVPSTEWLGPQHELDYVRKDAISEGAFEGFKKRYLALMPHLTR